MFYKLKQIFYHQIKSFIFQILNQCHNNNIETDFPSIFYLINLIEKMVILLKLLVCFP